MPLGADYPKNREELMSVNTQLTLLIGAQFFCVGLALAMLVH